MKNQFIENMPKVELHCHIEGTLEPEMLFNLANRNQVSIPFDSVEQVKQAYQFTQLQDFLDIYYQGMNVLQTQQDFYDLTMAYLEKINSENVRHTEIFFDPQGHTSRGIDFETVITGIRAAMMDGESRYGITFEIIMCFLRHLSEEDAMQTLHQAAAHKDHIIGVGLDSSELGNPPEKFKTVFREARQQGYLCVAHAGEEGPPEYVWDTLSMLKVDRIDHGNTSLKDPELVSTLSASQMPLTVCPLSNLKLCVVDSLTNHPLKTMLEAGLCATVNSDDPAYFGGYMNDNYLQSAQALDLNTDQILTLARNSISASFASNARKKQLLEELTVYSTKT